MTVRLRITLLIVLAFLALCSVGGFALYQSAEGARQVKRVTEGVVPSAIHSVELMGQLKDVQMAALGMVSANDAEAAQKLHEQLVERKAVLQKALDQQLREADSDAQRGLVKEAAMSLENYFAAIDDTARFKLAGQQDAAEAFMAATVDQYLREQGQMIEAIQVEKRRSKDEAIGSLNAQLEHTTTTLLAVAAIAILGLAAAGYMLYRQIVRPIREMELKMTEIATSQDFSHRVPVTRMDEIGRSLTAFNAMVEKIQESSELVRRKTADIQAMLHTIPQGILTLQAGRTIHPEYSDHLARILEEHEIAGRTLDALLFDRSGLSADARAQAQAAIDACIGEDELNFSFNAHLLPQELQVRFEDDRVKVIELGWSPITAADGTVERLLLSLRDVTELRELARDAQARKEELAMVGELLGVAADKFREFSESAGRLLQDNRVLLGSAASQPDARPDALAALFRHMHTVKGNARTYGLLRIADAAHVAEQRYAALRDDPAGWDDAALPSRLESELEAVAGALQTYVRVNDGTLGRGAGQAVGHAVGDMQAVRLPRARIEELCARIGTLAQEPGCTPAHRAALEHIAAVLAHADAAGLDEVVGGVAASLPALARDLGKEAPDVVLQSGVPVAVKPQAADALRNAFMHLLRNALDHGIEPAAEREARGKPAAGRIRIGAALDTEELEIRLADDGRGLNLDRIQAQARAQGLIAEDAAPAPGDVAHLIFAPGFSTAGEVTAVSGRGVGMDAVKAFVESLGGSIQVVLAGGAPRAATPFETVLRLPARWAVAA
ncbi:ATP-binding protein [Paracidovorax avenae]|uniref:ATP-binding protein n=1 Tax=Paracidovorax avenae TaxID=80867 RepID=UPI000D1FF680|nr:ATP-binding protein [Paracidovorax avenae]AVT10155.1 chemotaxis protein CheA [Paracidovorax avenae]